MKRTAIFACLCAAAFVVAPPIASAAEDVVRIPMVQSTLQWVMSLVGLAVAIVGLILISRISRLTKGGAISGRASYIVVAFMLLGISSILNVVTYTLKLEISADFVGHIDAALRIVAMGFFVLYFQRVLAGLRGYVEQLEAGERTFIEDAGGSIGPEGASVQ